MDTTQDSSTSRAEDRLADFTRDRRLLLLTSMALVIGAASAFIAGALLWLIAVITNLAFLHRFSSEAASLTAQPLGLWVLVVPVAGGLVIGLMARYGSERIRGHGIPEALEAILFGRSRMGVKVAVLKPISSAISIGTGGPFGAEGPIIMTGGAFGSLFAQLFDLSAAERKTLLVAGAAGGMSAIFATPVAAVLLAVELLLFEWKPRSFIPVAAASVAASALRALLLGAGPIFLVPPHAAPTSGMIAMAAAVGILGGLASVLLTGMVYAFEDLFQKLPVHWMWWPAIGGLFIGAGGLIDPRVLGVGYDTIRALLHGEILGAALLGLLVGKALVWSIALGSGTSGGVLAPLLILGGALGAATSHWIPAGDPGLWAMIGMAAVMGGTMRSPLTSMIFAVELTHDLEALSILLAGCAAAHATTVLLLRRSILTEKVARRGFHVSREYATDPFEQLRVEEVMDRRPPLVPSSTRVGELSGRIAQGDPDLGRYQATLVVDDGGRLAGIITRGDVVRAMEREVNTVASVLEAGSRDLIVAHPDETVGEAVGKMLRNDIGRMPVVPRNDPRRVIGYLGRSHVLAARLRWIEHEHVREAGWLSRPPQGAPV
jgi:CIC family chloride channel protein